MSHRDFPSSSALWVDQIQEVSEELIPLFHKYYMVKKYHPSVMYVAMTRWKTAFKEMMRAEFVAERPDFDAMLEKMEKEYNETPGVQNLRAAMERIVREETGR